MSSFELVKKSHPSSGTLLPGGEVKKARGCRDRERAWVLGGSNGMGLVREAGLDRETGVGAIHTGERADSHRTVSRVDSHGWTECQGQADPARAEVGDGSRG